MSDKNDDNLPAPLVSPEVDLRDFAWMPIDVARLRDSGLASSEQPETCWAAMLLWCAAWHQVPAGSIPDDNQWQAKQAGYVARGRIDAMWEKVKEGALRGFVPCSDGRLYHRIVAEKAVEAWESKLAQQARTRKATEARLKRHSEAPRMQRHEVRDEYRNVERNEPRNEQRNEPRNENRDENATFTNRPDQTLPENRTLSGSRDKPERDEQRDVRSPSPAASVCMALKQAGMSRVNPGHPTLIALIDAGASLDEFLGAAPRAMLATGDQFAYLLAMVEGQRREAKAKANGLHRGPMPAAAPQESPAARAKRERLAEMTGGLVSRLDPATAAPAALRTIDQSENFDARPPALGLA